MEHVIVGLTLTILIVAAWEDYRTGEIPDWLTWPFILTGVLIDYAVAPWLLYTFIAGELLRNHVGGGDVKLVMTFASLTGFNPFLYFVLSGTTVLLTPMLCKVKNETRWGPGFLITGVILIILSWCPVL